MTEQTTEEIAEKVAEAVIEKFFLALGVNAKDPQAVISLQSDLRHLRAWREATETIKANSLKAAVTTIVAGALGFVGAHFYLK